MLLTFRGITRLAGLSSLALVLSYILLRRLTRARRVCVSAPSCILSGGDAMQDIVDFFPNLSSLVVCENNVAEIDFANFIDSKLHRLYDSLMRRGVSVATTRGSPITDNRYFYLATDSPRVVKDLVEKTIDLVDYHGGRMVNIFLTLNLELRHRLPFLADTVVSCAEDLWLPFNLCTSHILSNGDTETILPVFGRAATLTILRHRGQQGVTQNESTAINEILLMLTSKDARGELHRVSVPKVDIAHPHIS